jgi:hypothetical protein
VRTILVCALYLIKYGTSDNYIWGNKGASFNTSIFTFSEIMHMSHHQLMLLYFMQVEIKYFWHNLLFIWYQFSNEQIRNKLKIRNTSSRTTGSELFGQLFNITVTCGLYNKQLMIVIYNRNDSGQYYKTTITIIIDNPSLS